MNQVTELRVSKREHPELYELVEETLFGGESALELQDGTFEIISSEVDLEGDAAFMLVKL